MLMRLGPQSREIGHFVLLMNIRDNVTYRCVLIGRKLSLNYFTKKKKQQDRRNFSEISKIACPFLLSLRDQTRWSMLGARGRSYLAPVLTDSLSVRSTIGTIPPARVTHTRRGKNQAEERECLRIDFRPAFRPVDVSASSRRHIAICLVLCEVLWTILIIITTTTTIPTDMNNNHHLHRRRRRIAHLHRLRQPRVTSRCNAAALCIRGESHPVYVALPLLPSGQVLRGTDEFGVASFTKMPKKQLGPTSPRRLKRILQDRDGKSQDRLAFFRRGDLPRSLSRIFTFW